MKKIAIYLKSGQSFSFCCTHFKVKHTDGHVTGWSADGLDTSIAVPLYIDPVQIAAVTVEGE